MEIKIETAQNALIVRLKGEFDMMAAENFKNTVDSHLSEDSRVNLLLDMTGVSFMDSSGLGAILGRYKKISQANGNMAIVGVKAHIKRVLELSGVMKIMNVFDDEDSALSELA